MPERLVLGAGMHSFSASVLERYRQAVMDATSGARLEAAVKSVRQQPGVEVGAQSYKRLPPGLPADHPRAEWLRHGSLYAAFEQPVPEQTFSDAFAELCFQQYERFAPLQRWLVDLLAE